MNWNESKNRWENLPKTTTVTDKYTLLVLDNGNYMLSFGDKRKAGDSVHILDPDGFEVHAWSSSEWGSASAEEVMGAIFRSAASERRTAAQAMSACGYKKTVWDGNGNGFVLETEDSEKMCSALSVYFNVPRNHLPQTDGVLTLTAVDAGSQDFPTTKSEVLLIVEDLDGGYCDINTTLAELIKFHHPA